LSASAPDDPDSYETFVQRHTRPAHDDNVRLYLAVGFGVLFAVTALFGLLMAAWGNWTNVKDALQIILPAELAILGSVVGFYFATKRN
jgi:hypothetical protein